MLNTLKEFFDNLILAEILNEGQKFIYFIDLKWYCSGMFPF
jgi:hypothetical protein